jgi:hypothetical protein
MLHAAETARISETWACRVGDHGRNVAPAGRAIDEEDGGMMMVEEGEDCLYDKHKTNCQAGSLNGGEEQTYHTNSLFEQHVMGAKIQRLFPMLHLAY